MNFDVSILILAAGASTRMKKIKQLLPWGDQSLIEHLVRVATTSDAKNNYLLLGAYADQIRPQIQNLPVDIVENKEWDKGLGHSIAIGVHTILDRENPDAILVMLGDQPYIDTAYINLLIQKFVEKDSTVVIVGTQYKSKIGVPAIFSPSLYEDLLNLDSDKGAATLIANNLQSTIAVDPKGKERDMDLWEDYIEMRPK